MKILVYSANFAPEPTGIGKYSGEMAAWLAEQGHAVRVVCAPPYYPSWKIDPAYASPAFRREMWKGVDVWRAPLWIPKSPGGLARVLHLLSFAITSFPLMMRQIFWRPDLVVCVAPALLCAPAGLLTARLSRAKAWLHLQDFEVDVAFGMGLLKGKLLQRIVLRMERTFLRRFDAVSSISNRMVELLLSKGVSQERTRYFPNWVDTSKFKPTATGQTFRTELNIAPQAVVAVFSGTLSGKQGLMVIPAAAKLLANRQDITFVICGDGLLKPELEAATSGMANVRHLPLQPVARLGELFSMADVHLLPQNPDAADLVLPSKLSGMLASGRPVIATCRHGTEIEMVVTECGLVVPPEDSVALAAAVCQLADDAAMRLELGKRARAYAQANFERAAVLKRFFEPLDSDTALVANDDLAA
jgi:colanic acid biosynthesis glycosyl transferase WcaI